VERARRLHARAGGAAGADHDVPSLVERGQGDGDRVAGDLAVGVHEADGAAAGAGHGLTHGAALAAALRRRHHDHPRVARGLRLGHGQRLAAAVHGQHHLPLRHLGLEEGAGRGHGPAQARRLAEGGEDEAEAGIGHGGR